MRSAHLFSLLLLITVLSCALPVLCVAQNGDSLKVSLNPLPDDKGSMEWWTTWLPSWEVNASFRATLEGNMQDLNTGEGGFIESTKYIFSFPLNDFMIDDTTYDGDGNPDDPGETNYGYSIMESFAPTPRDSLEGWATLIETDSHEYPTQLHKVDYMLVTPEDRD